MSRRGGGRAYRYTELIKLRDTLRRTIEDLGHVLNDREHRQVMRIVARLDQRAAEIEAGFRPVIEAE